MRLLLTLVIFGVFTLSFPHSADGGRVSGNTTKNGVYRQPHYRSTPDGNPYNNYSYPGNINPYTGETAKGNPSTYLENYYPWSGGGDNYYGGLGGSSGSFSTSKSYCSAAFELPVSVSFPHQTLFEISGNPCTGAQGIGASKQPMGQTIDTSDITPGTIYGIEISLGKEGSPTDDIVVSLRSDMQGTDLTTATVSATTLPTSPTYKKFQLQFSNTIETRDVRYLIVRRIGSMDTKNFAVLRHADPGNYLGGSYFECTKASCPTIQSYDVIFKLLGESTIQPNKNAELEKPKVSKIIDVITPNKDNENYTNLLFNLSKQSQCEVNASLGNDGKCYCNKGFINKDNQCVSDINQNCKMLFGDFSKPFGSEKCVCKEGYTFNKEITKCISLTEWCSDLQGRSTYNSDTKSCQCDAGFTYDGKSCVSIEPWCPNGYNLYFDKKSCLPSLENTVIQENETTLSPLPKGAVYIKNLKQLKKLKKVKVMKMEDGRLYYFPSKKSIKKSL